MGCFLACLRFKDDKKKKTHLKSSPIPSKSKEPLLSKDQFVPVFISEGSPCEQEACLGSQDDVDKDFLDRELKDEAKFLKSCGALLETPAEIRKASEKLIAQTLNKDDISSNLSSFLPGTSFKKLLWDVPLEVSSLPQNCSAGFNFEGHQPQMQHDSALSSVSLSNSVCLEGVKKHDPGVESGLDSVVLDISPSQADTQIQPLGSKHSPYPTPMKLTDEMETPGTIYPAHLDNLRSRKHAGVRTQYVYPVLNPVENLSQWTELREGSRHLGQLEKIQQLSLASSPKEKDRRNLNRETFDKENYGSGKSQRSVTPLSDSREKVFLGSDNPHLVVTSLSQWLKPPPADDERRGSETIAMKDSCSERTPDGDRPIFGIVATHWNEDKPCHVSPKWWGGNGIPNTTTKYKEDQKVSWHATPFEERLDKALSDDKLFPQRKLINRKLVGFEDEGEESDTVTS